MPSYKKKSSFFETAEAAEIKAALQKMEADMAFNTLESYKANGELHPDNTISFTDKHMLYLSEHHDVDPQHYLANLRLMTRKK